MKQLSIYVPTWNRPELLDRLLGSLQPQMCDEVEVFVSVNKSDVEYRLPDWVQFRHTEFNVGGDVNICVGPTLVGGKYCWVVGDDEQFLPGAIQTTLEGLQHNPGLIIHPSATHDIGVPLGSTFPNYATFCEQLITRNAGWVIAAHTLISSTTFIRDRFDPVLAFQKIDTRYGFHYGMLANLLSEPVHVLNQPTMLYGKQASIFLCEPDIIAAHMAGYPKIIHDIFDWIFAVTGYPIPHREFSKGFDS